MQSYIQDNVSNTDNSTNCFISQLSVCSTLGNADVKQCKISEQNIRISGFQKISKSRICQSETDMQTTPDEKSFDPGHHWGNSRYCFYCNNCTNFVQLCLTKIIIIVATRCQILRLKCIKFDFGWGSAPDPDGEAYSAPQTP